MASCVNSVNTGRGTLKMRTHSDKICQIGLIKKLGLVSFLTFVRNQ